MDLNIKFLTHKETNEFYLKKIVNIKMQHWEYNIEENLDWINKNIGEEDYHLLIENENDEVMAYLNLVNLDFFLNERISNDYLGLGNVCVDKRMIGMGLGIFLIQVANFQLRQLKKIGCLLCKPNLNGFYEIAGWNKYEGPLYFGNEKIGSSIYFTQIPETGLLRINKLF